MIDRNSILGPYQRIRKLLTNCSYGVQAAISCQVFFKTLYVGLATRIELVTSSTIDQPGGGIAKWLLQHYHFGRRRKIHCVSQKNDSLAQFEGRDTIVQNVTRPAHSCFSNDVFVETSWDRLHEAWLPDNRSRSPNPRITNFNERLYVKNC